MFMNLITKLLMLESNNVIYTIINRFLKERYYVFYHLNDQKIFIKKLVEILL